MTQEQVIETINGALAEEFELEPEAMRPEATLFDDEVVRGLLYAPGYTIMGGTSDIMRNILGERVLGLPREPRPA